MTASPTSHAVAVTHAAWGIRSIAELPSATGRGGTPLVDARVATRAGA